jgi:hypothetical protein
VNTVDQQRTATGLVPPCLGEIAIRLAPEIIGCYRDCLPIPPSRRNDTAVRISGLWRR